MSAQQGAAEERVRGLAPGATGSALLGAGDPPPFTWDPPVGRAPLLVVCDHASRAFPASLAQLGLPDASTLRHIAWDIGAAELARALARRLEAAAVLAGYSRLVIDCNRRIEDPTSMPELADGEIVPGNRGLTRVERERRIEACYRPYHVAIAAALARFEADARVPVVLAVHSFTPVFGGFVRPWEVGVLWDRDARIAAPLLRRLSEVPGLCVGDNEPYSGRHPADWTVDHHAESAGLPHVCVEVRQDLLATPAGVLRMTEVLVGALAPILATPALYRRLSVVGR